MPVNSLDELLGIDTMTTVLRTMVDQADSRSCSRLFSQRGRPLLPEGESASWEEVEYSRHFAPVTGLESPHPRATLLGKRKRSSVMAMVKAYKDLPGSHLFLKRAPGSDFSDAQAVLTAELEDLANLIFNTREFLACGALLGKITVNAQTVRGSDVAFEVEFGNHKAAALDPWVNANAKIRSREMLRLKQTYKDQSGLRAEIGITEPTVESLFIENDQMREFAKEAWSAAILQNLQTQGEPTPWTNLATMSWRFTDGTYKPEGGPVTRYFPKHHVVVLPGSARLGSVLGWAEGKVHVPAGPILGPPQQAASFLREMRGFYAYAELRTDPAGIRVYAGWYGLPVVLNPNAVMLYDINPQLAAPTAPTP